MASGLLRIWRIANEPGNLAVVRKCCTGGDSDPRAAITVDGQQQPELWPAPLGTGLYWWGVSLDLPVECFSPWPWRTAAGLGTAVQLAEECRRAVPVLPRLAELAGITQSRQTGDGRRAAGQSERSRHVLEGLRPGRQQSQGHSVLRRLSATVHQCRASHAWPAAGDDRHLGGAGLGLQAVLRPQRPGRGALPAFGQGPCVVQPHQRGLVWRGWRGLTA